MTHKGTVKITVVAITMALAMMLTMAPALAQGRGGGGGHGGGMGSGSGGSGKATSMFPTASAPVGSAATLGTTKSRGFGVPTIRISATGMPLPTATCSVPYSVHLAGTELEEPPEANPAAIDVTLPMMVAGTTPPTCEISGGVATWRLNGVPVTTAEFGFNYAAEQGFSGTAEIVTNENSTSTGIAPETHLFTSSPIELARRVNPNRGTEEGGEP